MKIRLASVALAAAFAISQLTGAVAASASTFEFIVGERTDLESFDFDVSPDGTTFTRSIPLVGAITGPLDFRVRAYSWGQTGYDTGFRCWRFDASGGGPAALTPGQAPFCHVTLINPSRELVYQVEVSVACSGVPITQGSKRDVRTLDASTLELVRASIDPDTGVLRGTPFDGWREGSLLNAAGRPTLTGHLADASACRNVEVTVRALGGARLEDLTVSIDATQPF